MAVDGVCIPCPLSESYFYVIWSFPPRCNEFGFVQKGPPPGFTGPAIAPEQLLVSYYDVRIPEISAFQLSLTNSLYRNTVSKHFREHLPLIQSQTAWR